MSVITSIIIYLATILTTVCAFHVAGKSRRKANRLIATYFAISIPVFLAGIRYATGTDYFSYIDEFERIRDGLESRISLEYGYIGLNILLSQLGLGAQSIMYAASLIMMCFVSKALLLRRRVIPVGVGALVFMLLFYQSSFNLMRMMIAVSIFLYNISNIENRKIFKFLLFTVLAASFHISALITAPLYWVFNSHLIEKSLLRKILLYGGVGLVIIYLNPILEWVVLAFNFQSLSYYEKYIGVSDKSVSIAIKHVILYLPIIIPGAIMYKRCKKLDQNFHIYYYLVVIGVIITGLAVFKVTYIDRIANYFLIAAVMVVPVYMRIFKKNNLILLYVGMICYLFLYWIYIYFIINNHGTNPFQWIL